MIELILIGAAVLMLRRHKQLSGIGRIKRRIYKEVSDAQNMGVDFSKKYAELDNYDIQYLTQIGKQYGWKQSKRSITAGKPYAESYYNSLKRAWNAVSGVQGIGKPRDYRDYRVYNSDGKTVLIYREYEPAIEHIEQESPVAPTPGSAYEPEPIPEPTPEVTPESVYMPEPEPAPAPKPKKPRKAKVSEEDKYARRDFAEHFYAEWAVDENNSTADFDHVVSTTPHLKGKTVWEIIIDAFADGTLKVKKDRKQIYAGNIWSGFTGHENIWQFADDLIKAWKQYLLQQRTDNADLDTIRIALLDKAKHMTIDLSGTGLENKEGQEWLIKGDDRYNYLPYINYVVMVRQTFGDEYSPDGRDVTIYPIRAFDSKKEAEDFAQSHFFGKTAKEEYARYSLWRKAKVVPIVDVDIQSISGISGLEDLI